VNSESDRAARSPELGTRLRIGQGFDTHAFAPGRPLLVGGVRIDYPLGLAGHSDGDALLHAVADALLGAAGLGDIGQRFPSDDPRYLDADSRELLRLVITETHAAGWSVVNVDVTVIAQKPRLGPHVARMREQVAALLHVEPDAVVVKAKSTDHLGALGRGEGLAALAVALLISSERSAISGQHSDDTPSS
jgi:2-C-methyl-D-erythritol 2,4-cyclodiphosphate synthase